MKTLSIKFDAVAKYGRCESIGGQDYRASPDWSELLGYSPQGSSEANLKSINFQRVIADEYALDIPEILIQGLISPRGNAYQRNPGITEIVPPDDRMQ